MTSLSDTSPKPVSDACTRPNRRWFWLLVAAYLAHAGLRLWFGSHQFVPGANPDETGYLFAARVLSGGADADLTGWPFYQIGYPVFLTPAFWFGRDSISIYHWVIGINSFLSALIVPLGYLAARRFQLGRVESFVVAQVTGVLPASIFFAQYALTDTILPVVVLVWLLLIHTWLTTGRLGWAAAIVAAYAYATHSRGVVLLLVFLALLGVLYDTVWVPRRTTLIAGVALLGGFGVAYFSNKWLLGHVYPGGTLQLGEFVKLRLTSASGWARILSGGLGQIWYLVVSTWGLAGVGLVAAALALRRGPTPTRVVAGVTLVTTLGIAFLTTAALPDEHRVANFVYGRYLACLAPTLFLAGAATLLRADRRRTYSLAAGAVVIALVTIGTVAVYAGPRLTTADYTFVQFDFPETSFLTRNWYVLKVWPATLAALSLLLIAVLFVRIRPVVAAAVLGAVGIAANVSAVTHLSPPAAVQRSAAEITGLRADDKVVMDQSLGWRIKVRQTFQVPSEIELVDLKTTPVPADATLVIVGLTAGQPTEESWPGGAPKAWRSVITMRSDIGYWVAWRKR